MNTSGFEEGTRCLEISKRKASGSGRGGGGGGHQMTPGQLGSMTPWHSELAGAYLVLYLHRNERKAGDRAAVFENIPDTKI